MTSIITTNTKLRDHDAFCLTDRSLLNAIFVDIQYLVYYVHCDTLC